MASDQKQPDWLELPSDLLEPIAKRSRDAVTGHTVFRSVCRAWRSAVGQAPRLLLPAALDRRAGSEHALVFPLSRGWSVVVDARDASCRLSHLATGTTVVLPNINAFRDPCATSGTTHVKYVHYTDDESDRGNHRNKIKIKITEPSCQFMFHSYLEFSDCFRFAVHFSPGKTPEVSTDGMMIMMCHRWLAGRRGMVFCRPGDAAWTEIARCSTCFKDFIDFAYFQGKFYGLEGKGVTKVYEATTLKFLHQIDVPQATLKLSSYLDFPIDGHLGEFHYMNLVVLPTKVLLVRTSGKSSGLEGFDVFESGSKSEDNNRITWHKVTWDEIGGNYELFLDGYHTAFGKNNTGSGTRIYCVLGRHREPTTAAYCYDMGENKFECIYRTLANNNVEYSTKPSWFVP